jgi:hemoglobin
MHQRTSPMIHSENFFAIVAAFVSRRSRLFCYYGHLKKRSHTAWPRWAGSSVTVQAIKYASGHYLQGSPGGNLAASALFCDIFAVCTRRQNPGFLRASGPVINFASLRTTRRNQAMTEHTVSSDDCVQAPQPDESNIRALVEAFYQRVDADPLLGPIFARELSGRWDAHLAKMTTFWSSLVLGSKKASKPYSGNVQEAHRPLDDIAPQHFARWLALFLDTVKLRYEPAAAVQFMEPALRIAQSLQLSKFGWDYAIPADQQALLASLKRLRTGDRGEVGDAALPERGRGKPISTRITGHATKDSES